MSEHSVAKMPVCLFGVNIVFLIVPLSWMTVELASTHTREGNILHFTCRNTQNRNIASDLVTNWINVTGKSRHYVNLSPLTLNTSWIPGFYELRIQEGTFFCEVINGRQSNGLGSFTGQVVNLILSANTRHSPGGNSTSNVTKDVTFVCPIQLEVFLQAYSVTWWFTDNDTLLEHYNHIIDEKLSSMTIFNIQRKNNQTYGCTVNVTNLYDGTVWTSSSTILLRISRIEELAGWIVFVMIAMSILVVHPFFLCMIFCIGLVCGLAALIGENVSQRRKHLQSNRRTHTEKTNNKGHSTRATTSKLSLQCSATPSLSSISTKSITASRARQRLSSSIVKSPLTHQAPRPKPVHNEVYQDHGGTASSDKKSPSHDEVHSTTSTPNDDGGTIQLKLSNLTELPHLNHNDDLKIHSNIGNGQFGSVWKVTYKTHLRAAKLLSHHAQEIMTDGRFPATAGGVQSDVLKNFKTECNLLETYQHKNIVGHFATLTDPKSNLPILVMELLDCTLKAYLESEEEMKCSILCHISLCLDISRGLKFLHSHDIIHRDLCDVNILLATKGRDIPKAKVADLGMARSFRRDYKMSILHREVYIPPEAREYPYHYSHSVDIYSFGVIAIQIINVLTRLVENFKIQELFDTIPGDHFLKSTIRSCISLDRKKRPKAAEIVKKIRGTK